MDENTTLTIIGIGFFTLLGWLFYLGAKYR